MVAMAMDGVGVESYTARVDRLLRPRVHRPERVLDLFAGCGGLALGFEAAGFETIGFEANPDCCATYNANLTGSCTELFLTPQTNFPDAEVVIGGPPCQPFSVGGNQLGLEDARDGFPAFTAAIEQLHPKLWMFGDCSTRTAGTWTRSSIGWSDLGMWLTSSC